MTPSHHCRSCGAGLEYEVLDLGRQPLANSYVTPGHESDEPRYPLRVRLCTDCGLVQVDDVVPPEEIFSDYAYFSSYSDSWVQHARRFATDAIVRFGLGPGSQVVELASNDGYLLQHFLADGVTVLGVEPAANIAAVATDRGIPTVVGFFGTDLAGVLTAAGHTADLVVANNVLAHVPDLNDFVAGIAEVLGPRGVVSIEAPHLARLVEQTQFDTIYHEHFSYFSLTAAMAVLERHGLQVFDVQRLSTHGGSLRIWAQHRASGHHPISRAVSDVVGEESAMLLTRPEGFAGFVDRVRACRTGLVDWLHDCCGSGRRVVAYGAAAKGNTLLNYAGVDPTLIEYVVDRNPAKQGRLLPGTHLPIEPVERLFKDRPERVLILPWNLRDEIVGQLDVVRSWGARFATAVPVMQEF